VEKYAAEASRTGPNTGQAYMATLSSFLCILHSCFRLRYGETKEAFRTAHGVQILDRFSAIKLPDKYHFVHVLSIFVLSYGSNPNHASDREVITVLTETREFMQFLATQFLKEALDSPEHATQIFHLDDILFGLDAMAVIPDNLFLMADCGVLDLVIRALIESRTDGNASFERVDVELLGAIHLVAEFAKIEDCRRLLYGHTEVLQKLERCRQSQNERIRQRAARALVRIQTTRVPDRYKRELVQQT